MELKSKKQVIGGQAGPYSFKTVNGKTKQSLRGGLRGKAIIMVGCFVILLTISFFLPNFNIQTNSNNNFNKTYDSDTIGNNSIDLDPKNSIFENSTITGGMEVYENIPTYFNTTFYDEDNYTKDINEAYFESKLVGDNFTFNNSVSGLNNSETQNGLGSVDIINGTYNNTDHTETFDNIYSQFNSTEIFHYPATYSFTDELGETGTDIDWVDSVSTAANTEIIAEKDSHKNVLQQSGDDSCNHILTTIIEPIETWIRRENNDNYINLYFYEGATRCIRLRWQVGGNLQYEDGNGVFQTIANLGVDTWYHFKISDITQVALGDDTCDFYIDGVLEVDGATLENDFIDGLDLFSIQTKTTQILYIDAWGELIDSDYNTGDNYHWQNYLGSETFENYNISESGYYYGSPDSFNDEDISESGYYYGSPDSFNDEAVGTTGTDIDWVDSASIPNSCEIEIISEFNEHKNVLLITHDGGASDPSMQHNFASIQTSGTIEFWWGTDDNTNRQQFSIYGASSHGPKLYIESNKFQYWDSAGYQDTGITATNDVLFHHKIIFDCDTDTFDWYIDGVLEVNDGSFDGVSDGLNKQYARLSTNAAYSSYFDALGYSWDLDYNLGDNINRYGRDTCNWIDETVLYPKCSVGILNEIDEHKNVLNIIDKTAIGVISITNDFNEQIDGTIEFWYRTTSTNKECAIRIFDGGTECITIILSTVGRDKYYDGAYQIIQTSIADTWQHFKLVFDCDSDTFDLYIDSVLKVNGGAFRNVGIAIDKICIASYPSSADYNIYIDAIGYSWDSNYNIGDNINSYGKEIISDLEDNGGNDIDLDPHTSLSINGEFGIHQKFLNLTDNTNTGNIYILDSFSDQTTGSIEFYIRTTDATANTELTIRDGGWANYIYLRIIDDKFKYYDGSWHDIVVCNDDQWYHVKFEWDCNSDWHLWINGTSQDGGSGYSFVGSPTAMDCLYIGTGNANYNYESHFDAFSYSWENDVGYNLLATNMPTLNFTSVIDFANYNKDLLAIKLFYAYKTDIHQLINMSVYNFNTGLYEIVNSSSNIDNFFIMLYFDNSSIISNYFNGSSIKLRFYGLNISTEFDLFIDYLSIKLYYKYELSIEKTFTLKGNWKYRWHVISSSYYSDWIYFEVIVPYPNVEMISESPYATRWDFTTENSTEITLYQELFDNTSQGYWDLYNVENRDFNSYLIQPSIMKVVEYSNNYGLTWSYTYYYDNNGEILDHYTTDLHYHYKIYEVISNAQYLYNNYTQLTNITFAAWETDWEDHDLVLDIKGTDSTNQNDILNAIYLDSIDVKIQDLDFYESEGNTIIISNYSVLVEPRSTYVFNVSYELSTYKLGGGILQVRGILPNGISYGTFEYRGVTQFWNVDARMRINNTLSKNYHGDGMLYCQTDEEETLTLRSPNNVSLDLQIGDWIEITFNTTSSNLINLNLLKSNTMVDSFILSQQGNTNYNTRTLNFYISDDISIDQLEFLGIFDEKNLVIDSVKILRKSPDYSFNVDPDGYKQVFVLTNTNYTIYVYENELLVKTFSILCSFDLQTLVYEAIISTEVYITLYDTNNEFLIFEDFIVYANYTLGNISYSNVRMSSNVLYVDSDILLQFSVYDSFGSLIRTYQIYEVRFIDIPLDIYSLKIQNNAAEYINYTLGISGMIKEGNILPSEIMEFKIATGNYTFNYTNREDMSFHDLLFELTDNMIILINTTYYTTYFSLYNQKGQRLDDSLFSLYINGTRKDFGFVELISDNINITVLDSLNITVFNQILSLREYNEYNIEINVYGLEIKNLAEEQCFINITTSGNSITFYLASGNSMDFVLSGATYILNFINYEDSYPRGRTFTLNSDKLININSTYHNVYFGLFTYDGLGIDHDLVRFYINTERRDFGLNTIQSETAHLIVLDYFNNTLANDTIDASAWSEWNIYVQIYSLYILNRFDAQDIIVNITQAGVANIWMEQLIPSASALLYRFLPNINYSIEVFHLNGTIYSTRYVNLTDNSHIESFGIPTQPEEFPKDVFFGVYAPNGLGIDHDLLRFYIDGNRSNFGFNTIENAIITLVVKDYFNSTLFNQLVNVSGIYEYNIEVSLYSIKIKNEARVTADYNFSLSGSNIIGQILADEILEFQVAPNTYILSMTNNENNEFHTKSIILTGNYVYVLNSTYYNIYFSLLDSNLHSINLNDYRFYLNNSITNYGLVSDLETNSYNIVILDRFNSTLFNSTIHLRNRTEYIIFIELYELQIRNLAIETGIIALKQTTENTTYTFSISPDIMRNLLIGKSNYTLNWTNGENNKLTTINISLNCDRIIKLNTTIIDPFFPKDMYISLYNPLGLGITDQLKIYKNNSRIIGGITSIESNHTRITVKDFFDNVLYDQVVLYASELNILIDITTVYIYNNFTESIVIYIKRESDSDWILQQAIEGQGYAVIQLISDTYTFRAEYLDGGKIKEKNYDISGDYKEISFGFYDTTIPYTPGTVEASIQDWILIAITAIIIIFALSCVIIIIYKKNKKNKAKAERLLDIDKKKYY